MAAEELSVRGLTGVDMTLRVAGPGTRSYAFVADWHIRLLLALAWVLAGVLARLYLPNGRHTAFSSTLFVWTVFIPAGLVYLLYHPVLEVVMHGRTPGKRIAGARIVTREGSMPGTGALLTRNLFRLIDSLPLFYVVGLMCCLFTAERVRFGDLAAGTVLVLDDAAAPRALGRLGALLGRGRLDPEALVLVQDLLDRWPELAEERRAALARTVLSRLEAQPGAAELSRLDDHALHSRLRALLASEPGQP